MAPRTPLAVAPAGDLVVVVDGPEVLAWDAATLQPRWQGAGEARFAAVAAAVDRVWLLDARGFLEQRAPADGRRLHRAPAVEGPGALAVDGDVVAVGSGRRVAWLRDGRREGEVLVDDGVVEVALGHGRLAVLDGAGTLTVVDLRSGRALHRTTVGGTPAALAAAPDGWWVAAGGGLVEVAPDGAAVRRIGPSSAARLVPVLSGAVVAHLDGDRRVGLLQPTDGRLLGEVVVGRAIDGVAGDGQRLWLSLGHGDVQRVDLLDGVASAAVPPRGRVRTTWPVDLRLDPVALQRAEVRRVVGAGPVAVRVERPAAASARGRRWPWVLGGTAVVVAGAGLVLAWTLLA